MPYSSKRIFFNQKDQLKIPKIKLHWSKSLAMGATFVANSNSSVRPTGGTEVYYCDLGPNLIVAAKERSGQIRAVSYSNVGTPYNENMWTIEREFPKPEAEQLFRKAQLSFGIDNTEILVPKPNLRDVA